MRRQIKPSPSPPQTLISPSTDERFHHQQQQRQLMEYLASHRRNYQIVAQQYQHLRQQQQQLQGRFDQNPKSPTGATQPFEPNSKAAIMYNQTQYNGNFSQQQKHHHHHHQNFNQYHHRSSVPNPTCLNTSNSYFVHPQSNSPSTAMTIVNNPMTNPASVTTSSSMINLNSYPHIPHQFPVAHANPSSSFVPPFMYPLRVVYKDVETQVDLVAEKTDRKTASTDIVAPKKPTLIEVSIQTDPADFVCSECSCAKEKTTILKSANSSETVVEHNNFGMDYQTFESRPPIQLTISPLLKNVNLQLSNDANNDTNTISSSSIDASSTNINEAIMELIDNNKSKEKNDNNTDVDISKNTIDDVVVNNQSQILIDYTAEDNDHNPRDDSYVSLNETNSKTDVSGSLKRFSVKKRHNLYDEIVLRETSTFQWHEPLGANDFASNEESSADSDDSYHPDDENRPPKKKSKKGRKGKIHSNPNTPSSAGRPLRTSSGAISSTSNDNDDLENSYIPLTPVYESSQELVDAESVYPVEVSSSTKDQQPARKEKRKYTRRSSGIPKNIGLIQLPGQTPQDRAATDVLTDPLSKEEKNHLLGLIRMHGDDWHQIAEIMNRTDEQLKNEFDSWNYTIEQVQTWYSEEDKIIMDMVSSTHESQKKPNWLTIADAVKYRTGGQCYLRYKQLMKMRENEEKEQEPVPDRPWTTSDDESLLSLVIKHGYEWYNKCDGLAGRTLDQCKERLGLLHERPTTYGKSLAMLQKIHQVSRILKSKRSTITSNDTANSNAFSSTTV